MASAALKGARSKAIGALYKSSGGRAEKQFRKVRNVHNPRYKYLRDRSLARRDARMARIASGNAKTVRALTPFRSRSKSKATSTKSSKGGSGTSNS